MAAGYYGGNFAALRYNRDGSLDTTFSGDGKVDVPVTAGGQGYAMTLQADGKIVVVGFSNANSGDFALMRFNTDGTLDTTFGTNGIRTTDFGSTEDIIHAVAIDAQGRIVVSGRSGGSDIDYAVARYNPNGSLDTSFGTNGLVKTHFGATYEQASGVLVQADGKIVVSGTTHGSTVQVALARYNDDGTLDTSFSGDGKLTNPNTTWGYRVAVAAGPGGKLLVSGTNGDFAVLRYNADGSLDTSFGGGDGTASVDLGGTDYAFTLTVQSDGRVVAAGLSLRSSGQYTIGIARFLADGSLDTSFDTDGWRIDDFGSSTANTIAYDVAVGNDGRIVMAGKAGSTSHDFAVAVYEGDKERLYAQQDANYNVTAITDAYGVVKERYLYDPYGAVAYQTATWGPQGSSNFSWVYLHQGGRYDNASRLYHFRNRDYSPSLGRWTRTDPLGYVDGSNLYHYVLSNPPSLLDPTGELSLTGSVVTAGLAALMAFLSFPNTANAPDVCDPVYRDSSGDLVIGELAEFIGMGAGSVIGRMAAPALEALRSFAGWALTKTAGKVGLRIPSGWQTAPAKFVREIARGEKIDEILNEVGYQTWQEGAENAVVSLSSAAQKTRPRRVIVSGGRDGIDFIEKEGKLFIEMEGELVQVRRVIGHTHPMPTGPSDPDFEALGILGQQRSYILELKGGLTKIPGKKPVE